MFQSELLKHVKHGFLTRHENITDQFQGNIVYLDQKHTSTCHIIDKPCRLEGDAFITHQKGIILAIQTADCVPILIANKQGTMVAAIHAGWRGAVQGIIENTIHACQTSDLLCVIGPCIHQKNYEVGQDLCDRIEQHQYFKKIGDKFLFDLKGHAFDKLKAAGIKNIDIIDQDTFEQKNVFFSRRRSFLKGEDTTGRQFSYIGL